MNSFKKISAIAVATLATVGIGVFAAPQPVMADQSGGGFLQFLIGGGSDNGGYQTYRNNDRDYRDGDRNYGGGDHNYRGGDHNYRGGDRNYRSGDRNNRGDRNYGGENH